MSISTFHDADIGIYGHRVQNVDIDVIFQMQEAGIVAVPPASSMLALSSGVVPVSSWSSNRWLTILVLGQQLEP
jgi:hypothetical protein